MSRFIFGAEVEVLGRESSEGAHRLIMDGIAEELLKLLEGRSTIEVISTAVEAPKLRLRNRKRGSEQLEEVFAPMRTRKRRWRNALAPLVNLDEPSDEEDEDEDAFECLDIRYEIVRARHMGEAPVPVDLGWHRASLEDEVDVKQEEDQGRFFKPIEDSGEAPDEDVVFLGMDRQCQETPSPTKKGHKGHGQAGPALPPGEGASPSKRFDWWRADAMAQRQVSPPRTPSQPRSQRNRLNAATASDQSTSSLSSAGPPDFSPKHNDAEPISSPPTHLSFTHRLIDDGKSVATVVEESEVDQGEMAPAPGATWRLKAPSVLFLSENGSTVAEEDEGDLLMPLDSPSARRRYRPSWSKTELALLEQACRSIGRQDWRPINRLCNVLRESWVRGCKGLILGGADDVDERRAGENLYRKGWELGWMPDGKGVCKVRRKKPRRDDDGYYG